jgi:hypothetical protein
MSERLTAWCGRLDRFSYLALGTYLALLVPSLALLYLGPLRGWDGRNLAAAALQWGGLNTALLLSRSRPRGWPGWRATAGAAGSVAVGTAVPIAVAELLREGTLPVDGFVVAVATSTLAGTMLWLLAAVSRSERPLPE